MLTPSGDVKVMDFGIARAISDASSAMTQTAAVVGTAQYLSPEQARGETVDSRSDVYSAGCLLYELLTGRPPFVGDSPVAVAYQHVREPAVPPSDHDTALTPEIDAIVMKALAKRVEDRYQSAAAMRADIERYLAGHPVRATAPPVPFESQTSVAADPYADEPATQSTLSTQPVPPEPDDDRGGNRTGLFVLLGALLVALIIGGAVLLPQLFEDPPEQVQVPDLIGMTESRGAGGDRRRRAQRRAARVRRRPRGRARQGDPPGPQPRHVRRPRHHGHDHRLDRQADDVACRRSSGRTGPQARAIPGGGQPGARSSRRCDSDEPKGQVVETRPAAGEQVPEGTRVTVLFSDGPEKVPDVVGMTEQTRRGRRCSRQGSRCS